MDSVQLGVNDIKETVNRNLGDGDIKETKQLLRLSKCQANDFGSQVAHMTSVFAAHASLGKLFESVREHHTNLLTAAKILVDA